MEEDDAAVLLALEELEKKWEASCASAKSKLNAVVQFEDARSLPRLSALASDAISALPLLVQELEILIPQHPSEDAAECYERTLLEWKDQHEQLRLGLRKANLRAKESIQKSAEEERQMLLSGGREGTLRRRNLETQAGLKAASESATESMMRTLQVMSQEVDRNSEVLQTLDQNNNMLLKVEGEYVGHSSLLSRGKKLLGHLKGSDFVERLVVLIGALFFAIVCVYILKKRIIGRGKPMPLLPIHRHDDL